MAARNKEKLADLLILLTPLIPSHLQCPNIVQFLGACIDPSQQVATVIVEYMPRGCLQSVLYGNSPHHLEWRVKLKIVSSLQGIDGMVTSSPLQLRDVCGGMAYLHSLSILHRMLTPRNILVSLGM